MKLQNNTKISSDILRSIIAAAMREVKCRSTGVFVQVNQGQGFHSSGVAYPRASWVRWGRKGRRVKCSGAFRLTLPRPLAASHPWIVGGNRRLQDVGALACAEEFFETAAHEASHIRDGQERRRDDTRRGPTGRREPHRNRPCERRADSRAADARTNIRKYEHLILALAEELDAIARRK